MARTKGLPWVSSSRMPFEKPLVGVVAAQLAAAPEYRW